MENWDKERDCGLTKVTEEVHHGAGNPTHVSRTRTFTAKPSFFPVVPTLRGLLMSYLSTYMYQWDIVSFRLSCLAVRYSETWTLCCRCTTITAPTNSNEVVPSNRNWIFVIYVDIMIKPVSPQFTERFSIRESIRLCELLKNPVCPLLHLSI